MHRRDEHCRRAAGVSGRGFGDVDALPEADIAWAWKVRKTLDSLWGTSEEVCAQRPGHARR